MTIFALEFDDLVDTFTFEEDLFMTAIADERAAVNKNPWIWYWGWWECNTCHIILHVQLSFFIIIYFYKALEK